MLTLAVIQDIVFPDVLTNWLELFTDDFKTLMRKAQGSWSSGKAYAIKYHRVEEFLFIHARVGQSFSNASTKAYTVLLCFHNDGTHVKVAHAKCFQCVGGEQSGWCHHVVMLLIGLMQFRMGIIKVCNTCTCNRAHTHYHPRSTRQCRWDNTTVATVLGVKDVSLSTCLH